MSEVLHDRRRLALLVGAAVVIALNWYTYIYGVNTERVVETSLGYFINPLVTVLLGVVVLRERLRPAQWVAVGVATLAVAVLTIDYGRPPWIALVLAASFGTYGLIKKTTAVGPAEGLAVESGALIVPALGYLIWLETTGDAAFGHAGLGNALLLALAGVVTSIPLLLFAGAARRVPLVTLGLLQYLAPTLQFLIGVLVLGEACRWFAGSGSAWCGWHSSCSRWTRSARSATGAAREPSQTRSRSSSDPAGSRRPRGPLHDAEPSQVCGLPAQHQPSFGARLLIHNAGTRLSPQREPISEKQWFFASRLGCCVINAIPSATVSGVRPRSAIVTSASFGRTLQNSEPRSTSNTIHACSAGAAAAGIGANRARSSGSKSAKPGTPVEVGQRHRRHRRSELRADDKDERDPVAGGRREVLRAVDHHRAEGFHVLEERVLGPCRSGRGSGA